MERKIVIEELNRIKNIMGIVSEQPTKKEFSKLIDNSPPSDYLGKGGTFEKGLYGGKTEQEYRNLVSKLPKQEIKKVRLIFPSYDWEVLALSLLKKFGIVTEVFSDLNQAISFVNSLGKSGVKVDEFVIGSHGDIGTLLITKSPTEKEGYLFNNTFLDSFKKIVHSGTKVFFTACYGADFLDSLKDAAERLGADTYGSAGIYNYITNESEEGFYRCSPKKFSTNIDFSYKPLSFSDSSIKLRLNANSNYSDSPENLRVFVTIKNGVFEDSLPPFSEVVKGDLIERSYSPVRNPISYNSFTLDIFKMVKNQLPIGQMSTRWKRIELRKNGISEEEFLRESIENQDIKIEIEVDGKKINVKDLKSLTFPIEITNDFLLKNRLCEKVSEPPITWI